MLTTLKKKSLTLSCMTFFFNVEPISLNLAVKIKESKNDVFHIKKSVYLTISDLFLHLMSVLPWQYILSWKFCVISQLVLAVLVHNAAFI